MIISMIISKSQHLSAEKAKKQILEEFGVSINLSQYNLKIPNHKKKGGDLLIVNRGIYG
jgi:hypothetical protein